MELRQLLAIIWRRKWIGITVFLSFVITIVGISYSIPTTYDATAKIMLRPSQGVYSFLNTLELPSGISSQANMTDNARSTLIALATIKPVADQVAKDLNLRRERVRAKIIKAIPFAAGVLKKFGIDVADMVKPVTGEDLIDKSLSSAIFPRPYVSVDQYDETNIVEIQAIGLTPEEARDIAERMADALIDLERQLLGKDFNTMSDIVEQNLASVNHAYELAMDKAKNFKQKAKFLFVETEAADIVARLVELRTNREAIQINLDRTMASIEDTRQRLKKIPQFSKSQEKLTTNSLIDTAKASLQTLYLELAASRTLYTNDHPKIIDIKNQISYLKKAINNETQKMFSSETMGIDPIYQTLTSNLAANYTTIATVNAEKDALDQLLKQYREKMHTLPATMKEYSKVDMELRTNKELVETLTAYARRIELAKGVSLSNIMMVAPPEAPLKTDKKHRHPNHLIHAIIAIFLGSFFGFFAMIVIEYVDDTIHSTQDLAKIDTAKVLGSIAKAKVKKGQDPPTVVNTPGLRDYFKRIQLEMDFAGSENPIRRLGVTSLFEDEGKHFFSVNHGILNARQGKRVVIMEADFKNPGLHNWFDVKKQTGLTQYLAGQVNLNEAIQPSGISGLDLMVAGHEIADFEAGPKPEKLLEAFKALEKSHDLVIFLSAPAFKETDTFGHIASLDGTIAVVESGMVRKSYFAEFLSLAEKGRVPMIGTVVNKKAGMPYHYSRYDMNPLEPLRNVLGKRIRDFKS